MQAVAAIDQGTTGTKAFRMDDDGSVTCIAAFEHRQYFPHPGWVEHDPEELVSHVKAAIDAAGQVRAIGIDNQGETIVAWDAKTGKAIYNAIVWQDNRTHAVTERLKADGAEFETQTRAGLPLDPYFSASKMRWVIDHVDEAKSLLKAGRLRLGTSDAWFLDRLAGTFATDVTTASRTSLMNLDRCAWDDELCRLFGVPMECLPEIRPTAGLFGSTAGGVPITASLVDQQAALFGHGCSKPGDAKITFGTGAFALAVAGPKRLDGSKVGILPTIAWKIGSQDPSFALDGGVYNAASAVNWARSLGLFSSYDEIGAFQAPPAIGRGLTFVPALSGLGCPFWDRTAAGLWIGMGLETTRADMMQSLLEGIALRAAQVVAAMTTLVPIGDTISIDGGLAKNAYFCGILADALDRVVRVPSFTEFTSLGTARMAAIGAGGHSLPDAKMESKIYKPSGRITGAMKDLFAKATERARGWRFE